MEYKVQRTEVHTFVLDQVEAERLMRLLEEAVWSMRRGSQYESPQDRHDVNFATELLGKMGHTPQRDPDADHYTEREGTDGVYS